NGFAGICVGNGLESLGGADRAGGRNDPGRFHGDASLVAPFLFRPVHGGWGVEPAIPFRRMGGMRSRGPLAWTGSTRLDPSVGGVGSLYGLCFAGASAFGGPFLHRRKDRKSTRLNSSHVKISYAVF